ncbi:MAG: Gfo/Idh/MocA family oxidoreductase [Bryobacterales bacterium]|nr:Gfo/Idh/MocA family oxidoreductase [Bryobacterales bacterium]
MEKNRRQFLKESAATVAPLLVPASAWGANDRVAYAMIGTGNRGGGLNKTFQTVGAQCIGLCDVYGPHLEAAKANSPAGVKTFLDYHELLAMPGLDAVVIATPDHQHQPMLYAALAANKDVYLEKPMSLNLAQSQDMVERVGKSDRIVQVGMQRRSMEFIRNARQVVLSGAIGKVSMVKAAWNWRFDWSELLSNKPLEGTLDWARFLGPAPKRELEPRRFRWWRAFWDYSGGNMTDQGTHLMDVVQWMTDSGVPKSAVAQGYIADERGGEVPDVFSAVFEYPEMIASWTLNYTTTYDYDWSIRFLGREATMVLDRRGYRIMKNGPASSTPWRWKGTEEVTAEEPDRTDAGAHAANFLDCVRSRKRPNCPVEVAAAAVTGPHMANLALREDRKVKLGSTGMAIS